MPPDTHGDEKNGDDFFKYVYLVLEKSTFTHFMRKKENDIVVHYYVNNEIYKLTISNILYRKVGNTVIDLQRDANWTLVAVIIGLLIALIIGGITLIVNFMRPVTKRSCKYKNNISINKLML